MSEQSASPSSSKAVLEMLTVANEYCLFVEKADSYPKDYVLNYLQKIGPLIYLKGSLLPDIQLEDNSALQRFVTEENWDNIYSRLKELFGEDDNFTGIEHDIITGTKPTSLSIAEFCADIYQDMKDFVILYQKNLTASRDNAVKELRDLFYRHWGERILLSTNAIHKLLSKSVNNNSDNTTTL